MKDGRAPYIKIKIGKLQFDFFLNGIYKTLVDRFGIFSPNYSIFAPVSFCADHIDINSINQAYETYVPEKKFQIFAKWLFVFSYVNPRGVFNSYKNRGHTPINSFGLVYEYFEGNAIQGIEQRDSQLIYGIFADYFWSRNNLNK